MNRLFPLVTLLFLASLSCNGGDDDDSRASTGWNLSVLSSGAFQLSHEGRALFVLTGMETESFRPNVTSVFGVFNFGKSNPTTTQLSIIANGREIRLEAGGTPVGSLTHKETPNGNLRLTFHLDSDNANAVRIRFACEPTDRFWGFGEQYNYVDLRGIRVPVWVSEQGLGRDPNGVPPSGSYTTSYFPMPYFIDPSAGKGLLVENSEYSVFDLCAANSDEYSIEIWNGEEISILLFPGPQPADVVGQLTSEVGRAPTAPPDWALGGVWIAAQGGTEKVRNRVKTALDAGIPITAVWAQDWLGLRHFFGDSYGVKHRWIWDEELYPGLPDLIAEVGAEGVRFLGYLNNFVLPDFEHFAECSEEGYLIQTPDGEDYLFQIITFQGSIIDLTNQAAVEYFKSFARKAVEMGMAGWMVDYAEWMPFDAVLHEGEAPTQHNLYPEMWLRANREVLEEARPDGDFVTFNRSGYTGIHDTAQVVWAGDQEVNFEPSDGMPTVVTAGLTIGLSGIGYFSHDIAGFSGGPRQKELFLRWTEMGAFTPIMRTHDGLQKLDNHHFDSDEETIAHFARFAKIHQALLPYFSPLAQETTQTGLPMIRHTVLVDPDWEPSLEAHSQWMLGNDLLFAPVVTEDAETIEVYFPEGDWVHLLTGETHEGRTIDQVDAPIGQPAVFYRASNATLKEIANKARAIE